MRQFFENRNVTYLLIWAGLCCLVFCVLGGIYFYLRAFQNISLPIDAVLPTETMSLPVTVTAAPVSFELPAVSPSPQMMIEITVTPIPELVMFPTNEPEYYDVQEGDTLFGIASYFGVSVETIQQANNLEADWIYPGQTLLIPDTSIVSASDSPGYTAAEGDQIHTVLAYDTLESIAKWYNVDIAEIRKANAMVGNAIFPGQGLVIPGTVPVPPSEWEFSVLDGSVYPIIFSTERFALHYAPGTYAANNPQILADMEQKALEHLESLYGTGLDHSFDVFVAGSLFAPPDRGLRGRSFSGQWINFLLFDGTGDATDQQYMAAHELTHLYTWNVYGMPTSVMLSEGAAVYSGTMLLEGSERLPLEKFCAVYLQAGSLPLVSGSLSFNGHNFDLVNYYSAGCFVGYLIETYGPEKFGQVYPSNNFEGIYGRSLQVLEEDWRAHLSSSISLDGINPDEFIPLVKEVTGNYSRFLSSFNGSSTEIDAYRALDQARIAMLDYRLQDARQKLEEFTTLSPGY